MPTIVIVGDTILDEYVHASVTRRNPECPAGCIHRVDRVQHTLGGAGAVAKLCRDMTNDDVQFRTVVGMLDRFVGTAVLRLLDDHQVASYVRRHGLIVAEYSTPRKQRLILDGQLQPNRVDYEARIEQLPEELTRSLTAELSGDCVWVLQDYGKGVLSDQVIRAIFRQARNSGQNVIVDPAMGRPWKVYQGASIIKANLAEARRESYFDGDPDELVEVLARKYGFCVAVTCGSGGIWWTDENHYAQHVPAVTVPEVVDPCGAGDTVVATLAVAVSHGLALREAFEAAAAAAAEQVGQVGVGLVPSQLLESTRLVQESISDAQGCC